MIFPYCTLETMLLLQQQQHNNNNNNNNNKTKLNSMALVRERTIPTDRPPPVGEVSANFCG
jgi:hypothetical protein